jgi:choline monooxygenase
MKVDQMTADIESGWTLPSSWYHDEQIYELERHRIFERSWQYVARVEEVAKPGDYLTATVGNVPIVVVRNDSGELAGFVNVCSHRLAEVVQGSGHRAVLQCHYHAWTYDLDGQLVSAPRADREARFDLADFCLQRVRVERFGPFVFANVSSDGGSLAEQLGDLPDLLRQDGLDFDELVSVERTEWEVAANWKVVVENFDECYHCAVAHPSFTRLMEVDPENYRLEHDVWWSRATTPLRVWPESSKVTLAYDPTGPVRGGQFAFLWPNFTLVQNPGQPNAMGFYFRPLGPERTLVVSEYLFSPDVAPELVRDVVAFNVLVGAEDQRLVESVQRGMRSDRVPRGRLMVDSERLIQHFQLLVHRALSD